MPSDEEPSRPLTLKELSFLSAIGAVFHNASGYRDVQDALDMALRASARLRESGVAQAAIVRALGIDEGELVHRQREITHKPRPPAPGSRLAPWPSSAPASASGLFLGDIARHQDENQSLNLSQQSEQNSPVSLMSHSVSSSTGAASARRVLFLSGNADAGRNDFTTEAAYIRQALAGSYIELVEKGAVALGEIRGFLDRHHPAVVHLAAHSSFTDVHLTQDGRDLPTSHKALCDQIARARTPPRLAILSFCDSYAMGEELSGAITSVISWPCPIVDVQALPFAQQLYRSLASGDSVATSCRDAEAAMGRRTPTAAPELHGDQVARVF
ncbi:CHAT domain-containing protein [Streptomyces sp. LARHCF252]